MAKNLGRKYATMSDEERRRFALEEEAGSRELPAELAFDEPRNALLDDQQHERAVDRSEADASDETKPEE